MPVIPNIQWEAHAKGGFEAWHGPPGAPRKEKVYIAYVGKRRLSGSPEEIAALVREKMRAKNLPG